MSEVSPLAEKIGELGRSIASIKEKVGNLATDFTAQLAKHGEVSVDLKDKTDKALSDLGAMATRLTEIESKGQSLAILGHSPHEGCAGAILGILSIGDTMRPEVSNALTLLHDAGIEKVVMLSGDNQRTVDAIARQAGIDEAYGDLMPDQKIEHIRRLMAEHHYVGMIGDGVNDAPALALASVGIAMGAIGSDTAIETADMALMKDDLTRVAEAIALGRRTLSVIQFNVAFALVVKAIFLILAFTGHTSLWLAILADTGATLLVILNALRLLGGAKNLK